MRSGSALGVSALVAAGLLFHSAICQPGPCYVAVPAGCVFFGVGVSTSEDCATFESELGRATQAPTSYSYVASSQECAILTPSSCQAFSTVLSLQVCSDNDAQAVNQILSTDPFQQGAEAPSPTPVPSAATPGSCFASVTEGQDQLCVILVLGLSSLEACTAAGNQIAIAQPQAGIKSFFRAAQDACGIVAQGPCGSIGAALGVQSPPCDQTATQQVQALINTGLYPAVAPSISRAPSTAI